MEQKQEPSETFKLNIEDDQKSVGIFARFNVGSPHTKFQWDEDWEQYCQGRNDAGIRYPERSAFLPAELSLRALLKQLAHYKAADNDQSHLPHLTEIWLREMMEPYVRGFRTLTLEEAIKGISDEFGTLEPLNMSTSPGFGFNLLASDKKQLFEEFLEFIMTLIHWDWDAIVHAGVIPMWFYKASEKDERRDFPRVIDFKTRLFMAECVISTITARRLYGDFVRRFMAAGKNLSFFSAAGMETYYGAWHEYIMYLTGNLGIQKVESFDMPQYDKRFGHVWHMISGDTVASFAADPDMAEPIMRSHARVAYAPAVLAITGGCFVRPCDNPSGQFMTTVHNTMGIERIFIGAWLRADGEATSIGRYHRFVRNKIIGDDLQFTISPGSPMQVEHFLETSRLCGWLPDREGTGFLDDSPFAGRASVLAQVGGYSVFLPMIARDKILAVNEYRKGKRNSVKQLARAYAGAELAFPTLFQDGECLFAVLYGYLQQLRRQALLSKDQELRAVAQGLPGLDRMWVLYTGRPSPSRELSQLLAKQINCAAKEGTTITLGPGS